MWTHARNGLRSGAVLLTLTFLSLAPRAPSASVGDSLERVRASWSGRTDEERARLERHLEEFQRLEAPARRRLLERARALREREHALEQDLSAKLRAAAEQQDAQRWRAELRERFRVHGRELRARLPKALRERLEAASPEERRQFLENLIQGRERHSAQVLGRMHELAGVSASELQHLERMPVPQRLRALRELGRQLEARPTEPHAPR